MSSTTKLAANGGRGARSSLAVVAALALLLGGCSGGADSPVTPTAPSTAEQVTPGPDQPDDDVELNPDDADDQAAVAQSVVVSAPVAGTTLDLSVGPLISAGDSSVLALSATAAPNGSRQLALGELFGVTGEFGVGQVRLVNAESEQVELPALDGDAPAVTTGVLTLEPGEPTSAYAVYGPQTGSTVDVFLPYVGVVSGVPVVARDDAAASFAGAGAFLAEHSGAVARVAPLESFRASQQGDLDSSGSSTELRVNVAADVLFAVDKATLSSKADATLTAAGKKIAANPAGQLTIIGHTDDVGTEDYNEKLSVRRAKAAAKRLRQLVDLSAFDLKIKGMGETQPRAQGTSATARALNRRVEIVFEPAAGESVVEESSPSTAAVKDSTGPSAPGPQGVELTKDDATVRARIEHVERHGHYLYGTMIIEAISGNTGALGPWFANGATSLRGNYEADLQFAPTRMALLDGGEWVYALDYELDGVRRPLVPIVINQGLDGTGSMAIPVVWPDVSHGGGTVTVDVGVPVTSVQFGQSDLSGAVSFRLTDVPVVN